MGIRLDGGTAYAGGVITRYYDSLLVKVTAKAQTPELAIARMDRALREFRIRGVSTNIAFVENLLRTPAFSTTPTTPSSSTRRRSFSSSPSASDRGTKVLTYIADITVNGHPETKGHPRLPLTVRQPKPPENRAEPMMGTRNLLEQKGPQAVADWMRQQSQLLITDTTMRDGHQSLLATRMRSHDMIKVAPSLCRQPAAAFLGRMLGRCDLRCGLPLLAGMPLAAPARSARAHAQHHDANAAARLERRRLHQLPRQRGAVLRPLRPQNPASTSSASSTASTGSKTCASRWTR